MKVLSINENKACIRVQSINGFMLIEEDWVKKVRRNQSENSKKPDKKSIVTIR